MKKDLGIWGEQYKKGFTLVELLVVIAIIGVLIALLLPAVQAAREAARRMTCSNQVKQLSLSLHNYHDTHQSFPQAAMRYKSGNTRLNVFVAVLPFMEQQAMYDTYTAQTANLDPWWANNDSIFCKAVGPYLCPSDSGRSAGGGTADLKPTSYRYSLGDWPDGTGNNKIANPRGAFSLYESDSRSMSTMADGTSNTIVFSEAIIGNGAGAKLKGAIATTVTMGTTADMSGLTAGTDEPSKAGKFKTNDCWTRVNGKEYTGATDGGVMGRRWGDAAPLFSGFSTVFPPNKGPSCTTAGGGDHNKQMCVSASSNHSGGVQVGLGDGSVRFTSDTINCLSNGVTYTTDPICVSSGKSNFGVWGALGSVAGGESDSGL